MAKKSFSTNMNAGAGVNLGKKAEVEAKIDIAGEEIVDMSRPIDDNFISDKELDDGN